MSVGILNNHNLFSCLISFFVSQKRSDTVAQFILDEINSTKSLEFADLFLVFIDAFELGNSIRSFLTLSKSASRTIILLTFRVSKLIP
jgi:hypothetical protein